MKLRLALATLLVTGLFGACSADLREANRCYALGKAVCKSMRITTPGCVGTVNDMCIDEGFEASEIDDCIDGIQGESGDEYGSCLETVPSACEPLWGQASYGSYDVSSFESDCSGVVLVGSGGCSTTYDGYCDEPYSCPPGTDTADCGSSAGGSGPGGNDDSCTYAFDGACDEPTYCDWGTDTSDCSGSSGSGGSGPVGGANDCVFAYDGACDEPDLCPSGTDTADCGGSSGGSCSTAPAQPSGASCPSEAPLYCGGQDCCGTATPYHCAATGQCFELAADAADACLLSASGCTACVPGNSGGPVVPGSCPCTVNTSACSPDPLAPACYCALASMSYCLADNASACQADAIQARQQGDDYVRAAIEIDPSIDPKGCGG